MRLFAQLRASTWFATGRPCLVCAGAFLRAASRGSDASSAVRVLAYGGRPLLLVGLDACGTVGCRVAGAARVVRAHDFSPAVSSTAARSADTASIAASRLPCSYS